MSEYYDMTEWTWRLRATVDNGEVTKMVVEDEQGPLEKDWATWDAEHPYVPHPRDAGGGSAHDAHGEPSDIHGASSIDSEHVSALTDADREYVNNAIDKAQSAGTVKSMDDLNTPKLSSADQNTLNRYSGDSFLSTNVALRAGDDSNPEVGRIDQTMRPLGQNVEVTRNIPTDAISGDPKDLDHKVITDNAYMSTTVGDEHHIGGVTMHLLVPEGTNGVSMKGVSNNPIERELLLERGSRVAVSRVEQRMNGVYDVYGTVLPPKK